MGRSKKKHDGDSTGAPPAPKRTKIDTSNPQSVLKAELVDANRAGDVQGVLRIFRKWRADEELAKGMQESIFAMVLSAILKACQTEADAQAWWSDAVDAFEGVRQRCKDGRVKENHVTLMVRLSAQAGRTAKAFEYLKSLPKEKVDAKEKRITPKFRSIMPILEACARVGDLATAEEVFRTEILPIKNTGILTDLEGLQWQDCCVCLLNAAVNSPAYAANTPDLAAAKRAKVNDIMGTLISEVPRLKVSGVSNPGETYHRESKQQIMSVLRAAGYECFETADVDPASGFCKTTGHTLRAIEIPLAELKELRDMIERLAVEGNRHERVEQWAEFRAWIDSVDRPYQHIIDAANVGHSLHGCHEATMFSHQQIDSVATEAPQSLIVIREHWVKSSTDLNVKKKKKKKKQPLPQLNAEGREQTWEEQLQEQLGAEAAPTETAAAAAADDGADWGVDDQLWEQMCGGSGNDAPTAATAEEGDVGSDGGSEADADVDSGEPTIGQQYRKKWEASKWLLLSPNRVNDDWVAMYVAVEMMIRGVRDVRLITNDIFRDHYWRMHHHPAVPVFMERNITKFHFSDASPTQDDFLTTPPPVKFRRASLQPPLPYSIKAQQDVGGKMWHIPFATEPVTWIAAKLKE